MSGVPALWISLLGTADGPYQWSLDTAPGEKWRVAPPYPSLDVVAADTVPVERLAWQAIRLRGDHATGTGEVIVGRLVAQLAGGTEIELHRTAIGADAADAPAVASCAKCGAPIFAGATVEREGRTYHERCYHAR
jgi:hypothetical protein